MADQIEEVKQKTDIVTVISEYITLKKAGRNYKALCPFHGEKTPSFMVSPELQIYKCFGCGESGDVFSFLEKYDGMEFGEALRYLADKAGVRLTQVREGEYGQKQRFYELNKLVSKFYNYLLLNHYSGKEALKYLTRERGLKMDTLKKFKLGFSPEKENILSNFLKKHSYGEGEYVKSGLLYKGKGWIDRFAGRVIFPLSDHRGNIIGFAGRILPKDDKGDKAKYINSPETPVYHKSRVLYGLDIAKGEIKNKKNIVVVEGELDMISAYQAGVKNVVAIKGSALTDEQVSLINRFADRMILALDTDFAGDAAARRGITNAFGTGLEIKVATFPGYKDPDEFARKNPEGLAKSLEQSVSIWDFFIDSTFSKFNEKTGDGKAKISREIVPVLSSIPDRIVQSHYITKVAQKLGVPTSAVSEEVLKAKPSLVSKEEKSLAEVSERKSEREVSEDRLMVLLFQSDPKLLFTGSRISLLKERINLRLAEELKKYLKKNEEFNTSTFSQVLPKELFDAFSKLMLTDINVDYVHYPEKVEKELGLIEKRIKIIDIKKKKKELAEKIKALEKEKQTRKLQEAEQELASLNIKQTELEEGNGNGIIL